MDNTPDSPAKTPEGYTTQGGNFWTLITPEIWKVLHAVLQLRQPSLQLTMGGSLTGLGAPDHHLCLLLGLCGGEGLGLGQFAASRRDHPGGSPAGHLG